MTFSQNDAGSTGKGNPGTRRTQRTDAEEVTSTRTPWLLIEQDLE